MILLGDSLIPCEETFFIKTKEEIKNSNSNSILIFEYNEDLLRYCFENSLGYGVLVKSLKEAIYSNALNAKYIVCDKNLDKDIQNLAENYMFDSKILSIIDSSNEIEDIALKQIDGVIYKNILG